MGAGTRLAAEKWISMASNGTISTAPGARPFHPCEAPQWAERASGASQLCVTRPAHVNLNVVEVMPADQGFGAFNVKRR